MANSVKLSSPWNIYYKKLNALFKEDDDIRIEYNNDNVTIKLFVNRKDKAEALAKILPSHKDFGGTILTITVIPPNEEREETKFELFTKAFMGNPVLSHISKAETLCKQDFTYVSFRKEVVQFFTDDLGDEYGMQSALYEDIARDVFEPHDWTFYCTDIEDIDEE